MKRLFIGTIAFFLVTVLTGTAWLVEAQAQDRAVRVNGAAMACDQVQIWADQFMKENPDIRIMVYGSSAGKGFDALIGGSAEIALASRKISADEEKRVAEKNIKLTDKLIGYAGLAVFTSPRNPVNDLSMEQLRQIFGGTYTNWNQVGGPDAPIRCLTRRIPESGGAMFFKDVVLRKGPYGPSTVFAESWTSIMKICNVATDLPIGMGPALVAGKAGVKVLGVKVDDSASPLLPTEQSLRDGSYPICNPIQMYWDSETKDGRIRRFVDYCAGKGLAKP